MKKQILIWLSIAFLTMQGNAFAEDTPADENNNPAMEDNNGEDDQSSNQGDGEDTTSSETTTDAPETITIDGVVRDFSSEHQDFESSVTGLQKGCVKKQLGENRKPILADRNKCDIKRFDDWYHDTDANDPSVLSLTLHRQENGIYNFTDHDFFPIDGDLKGNEKNEHNYHFTYEVHAEFTYRRGQTFHFSGDDDLWVFINNELVIDVGGVHGVESDEINLDGLGLKEGDSYPLDLFFAERHTSESNFMMETDLKLEKTNPADEIDIPDLDAPAVAELSITIVIFLKAEHITLLKPEAVAGLTARQVSKLSKNAIHGFTAKQISRLKPEAVEGFTPTQIVEIPVDAVEGFTPEQLDNIDVDEFTEEQKKRLGQGDDEMPTPTDETGTPNTTDDDGVIVDEHGNPSTTDDGGVIICDPEEDENCACDEEDDDCNTQEPPPVCDEEQKECDPNIDDKDIKDILIRLDAKLVAKLSIDFIIRLDVRNIVYLPVDAMQGFTAKQLEKLSPKAMFGLTARQIAKIDKKAMKGLKKEHITNIAPEAVSGLTKDQIENIEPEAVSGFTKRQTPHLEVEAVAGFDKKQMEKMTSSALSGFVVDQFEKLDVDALSGLNANNIGGLEQDVFFAMGYDILNTVKIEVVQTIPMWDLTWIFLNLDIKKVKLPDLQVFLPTGWEIDVKGKLKVKPGKIKLPKIKVTTLQLPVEVTMPQVTNLNVNLSVGGNADEESDTLLNQINTTLVDLQLPDFSCKQENGILQVEGGGESEGIDFAFIPDEDETEQVADDTPEGVSIDITGSYVFVTKTKVKFKLRPAPRDPVAITKLIPGGKIKVGKRGETRLVLKHLNRIVAGMFDPVITVAPPSMTPGVSIQMIDGREVVVVVYEDNMMQYMYPGIQDSEDLIEARDLLPDAQWYGKYQFDVTGVVRFVYRDVMMQLMPRFDVEESCTDSSSQSSIDILEPGQVARLVTPDGDCQTFDLEVVGEAEEFEGESDDITPTDDEEDTEITSEDDSMTEPDADSTDETTTDDTTTTEEDTGMDESDVVVEDDNSTSETTDDSMSEEDSGMAESEPDAVVEADDSATEEIDDSMPTEDDTTVVEDATV